MPGPILHMGAVVNCSHAAVATPTMASPCVFVSGMPIVTIDAPYSIVGCAFVPPAGNGPCVTGQWLVGATQVLSQGRFVAIMSGVSVCVPTGTPMLPVSAQTLVLAT
jgi:hypothetical protein